MWASLSSESHATGIAKLLVSEAQMKLHTAENGFI